MNCPVENIVRNKINNFKKINIKSEVRKIKKNSGQQYENCVGKNICEKSFLKINV